LEYLASDMLINAFMCEPLPIVIDEKHPLLMPDFSLLEKPLNEEQRTRSELLSYIKSLRLELDITRIHLAADEATIQKYSAMMVLHGVYSKKLHLQLRYRQEKKVSEEENTLVKPDTSKGLVVTLDKMLAYVVAKEESKKRKEAEKHEKKAAVVERKRQKEAAQKARAALARGKAEEREAQKKATEEAKRLKQASREKRWQVGPRKWRNGRLSARHGRKVNKVNQRSP
jgi:hypothetical protein